MGILRSAAARSVSPARTPSPPLYMGIPTSSAISMEKYAIVLLVSIWSPACSVGQRRHACDTSTPVPPHTHELWANVVPWQDEILPVYNSAILTLHTARNSQRMGDTGIVSRRGQLV